MLGQPLSMLIPQVIGVRLHGKLREGSTATDLVLVVTQMLRKLGVVGKLVEFFGPGIAALPVADRATIANMAPEYGATCGIFPIDEETLRYLRFSGRAPDRVALVEAYAREQGMFHDASTKEAVYTDVAELDLASVEPSVAGPKRPQDRVSLYQTKKSFEEALPTLIKPKKKATSASAPGEPAQSTNVGYAPSAPAAPELQHGSVVIAAITSCTNTSNPMVMVAAGLLAKKAVEKGLTDPPLGQDLAGAGLEGGDRVPRGGQADAAPRDAGFPHRRLRLHHLHRQLGAAAPADHRRHRGPRSGRRQRAVGQPQLRGAHQPRGARQLPDVTTAGRGLRPGRPDRHRPRKGAAGPRGGGTAGLPARRLAVEQRGGRRRRQGGEAGDVRELVRRGVRGGRALAQSRRSARRHLPLRRRLDLHQAPALLRGNAQRRRCRRAI